MMRAAAISACNDTCRSEEIEQVEVLKRKEEDGSQDLIFARGLSLFCAVFRFDGR